MRKKGKREWNEKKQRIEADRFVALSLTIPPARQTHQA
jgi:hypothetical protein